MGEVATQYKIRSYICLACVKELMELGDDVMSDTWVKCLCNPEHVSNARAHLKKITLEFA